MTPLMTLRTRSERLLFMVKGELRLTIPNPHRHAIAPPLLERPLRQAGIKREDWLTE